MRAIDIAGFELKFQHNIDPWNYTASQFEHFKRDVLLRACGCRTYGRGLELACAIGETTRYLAHRCIRLFSGEFVSYCVVRGRAAFEALPTRAASEIVYYIAPHHLYDLLRKLDLALASGGRIVVLDHCRPFGDAAQLPALAHRRVRQQLQKSMPIVFHERQSRFDVVAFEKPRDKMRRRPRIGHYIP